MLAAEETKTGDRDELVPGVGERAWRQVSVTAFECLGASACPVATECFSELARARAHTVDVVVTNHALLAIDTFEDVTYESLCGACYLDESGGLLAGRDDHAHRAGEVAGAGASRIG